MNQPKHRVHYELGQCEGLGGLLLLLYCLGALGRRCDCGLDCRPELRALLARLLLLLLSLVRLLVVTLRRILSPQALVPKVSIIMSD